MIIGAVGLPVLLAGLLVSLDLRSDLSDLRPKHARFDAATALVGWADLEAVSEPRRARMIGYMMEGYRPSREDAPVNTFILMPEAGHVLHAAHRIPDEMVDVWLAERAPFHYRSLVWVSGILARKYSRLQEGEALYAITSARLDRAVPADITRWFEPQ